MVDLIIVGAGVIGATSAYLCSQAQPDWRILLLDRCMAGKGATAYSAGLDFPYGRTPAQKHLSIHSRMLYEQFQRAIPDLPIFALPFAGIVKRARMEQVCAKFTVSTHSATGAERDQLMRSQPGLRLDSDDEVILGAVGTFGFVEQVTTSLIRQATQSANVQCWEGVAVTSIDRSNTGYHVITFDGRSLPAQRVLVCTGPWLLSGPGEDLAQQAGIRIKKVAALHVLHNPSPNSPIIYFFDEDAFLLPVSAEQKWIFSFTSKHWDCKPEAGELRIHSEERGAALGILERYYPEFVPYCSAGRVFCDAYSRDWAPVVTSDGSSGKFVMAGACSGAGFRLAPAIAHKALHLFSDFSRKKETA